MHLTTKLVAVLLLPLLLISAPARAQQARVVDADAMRQALAGKAESESAQRQLVRRVLSRDDVREGAARLGLNLQQADSAVATLTGSELQTLAEQASAIESSALAGGASTVVISTTTLLLILIIVILLAN
jgi:hypothetical protein